MTQPNLCVYVQSVMACGAVREQERCIDDILDSALQASAEILFSKGQFSDGGEGASTSGRTGHVEYCRTFGVLIATSMHSAAFKDGCCN